MKFSTTVAVATLVAVAAAQLDKIPTCAQTCLLTGIKATTCGADIKCACSSDAFVSGALACAKSGCSSTDYETAVAGAAGLCKAEGVEINTGAPASPSTTESAPASTSAPVSTTESVSKTEPAPPSYSAPVTTSTSVKTTLTTTGSVVVPPSTYVPVPVPTGGSPIANGTVTPTVPVTPPTAPPAAPTNGASSFVASGLLAGVGAVVALLL